MLRRLLKYDLKWVYKLLLIFYSLTFIFAILGRVFGEIENSVVFDIVSKFSNGFAISMMVNCLVNGLMRLWARFVRNVYKDESYLTHTLPVTKQEIFASKVIAAVVTTFTSMIVIIVSLFICYYSEANMETLKSLLELAATTYNTTVFKLLLLIMIVIFLEIVYVLLIGYVGIILGYQSNKNKMVKSIALSLIFYFVFQGLTLGFIAIYGLFNPQVMNLLNTTDMVNVDAIKSVMYVGIGIYVVYAIVFYVWGLVQFKKGVNVE